MKNDDRITIEMQAAFGFEWFGCDQDGLIASFDSCGMARIPESILNSNTERKTLIYYLKTRAPYTTTIHYDDILSEIKFVGSTKKYFRGCDYWGKRGIFVYDPTANPNVINPYIRVIEPVEPLHVDELPDDMRNILKKTQLPVRFKEVQRIDPSIIRP